MDNDAKKDTSVSISVIQFVDRAIESERRLTTSEDVRLSEEIRHLKELHAAEIIHIREVGAAELRESQRRLAELNHAHEQKEKDLQNFLPQPMFYQFVDANSKWRDEVNRALATSAGKSSTYAGIIGVAVVIVQFALHYLK